MRTVLRNQAEVAHVWAQRPGKGREGRTNSGHVFFEGETIYSYGYHFPVAKFVDGKRGPLVLFTTRSYSVTTECHKSMIRSAIGPQWTVVDVPNVLASDFAAHRENLLGMVAEIRASVETASRKRGGQWCSPEQAAGYWLEQATEARAAALAYRAAFLTWRQVGKPLRRELESCADMTHDQAERLRRAQERWSAIDWEGRIRQQDQRAQAAREERQRLDRLGQGERIKEWLAGNSQVRLPYGLPVALLRVKGKLVETSMGASVPVGEARLLYLAIRAGQDVSGSRIGHYRIDKLTDKMLLAGCHRIPRSEVRRVGEMIVGVAQ